MNSNPSIVNVSHQCIKCLDLTPLAPWANVSVEKLLSLGPILNIKFEWVLAAEDPRELSEYPELKLWSLHADANYPWLPLVLDRSTGQLVRHVAMLLPHQFSRQDGITFGPNSLELWLTHRLFSLDRWSMNHGLSARDNMIKMSRSLGYELSSSFWIQLDNRR